MPKLLTIDQGTKTQFDPPPRLLGLVIIIYRYTHTHTGRKNGFTHIVNVTCSCSDGRICLTKFPPEFSYFTSSLMQILIVAIMCELIPAVSMPPKVNPGHLLHDESINCQMPSPPGICKQQKTCFVTSCRHFRRHSESRVSNSQVLSFWRR